jgi:hypothetical protein
MSRLLYQLSYAAAFMFPNMPKMAKTVKIAFFQEESHKEHNRRMRLRRDRNLL